MLNGKKPWNGQEAGRKFGASVAEFADNFCSKKYVIPEISNRGSGTAAFRK